MARKFLITTLFFLVATVGSAWAGSSAPEQLEGHWFYFKKIYRGVEMPEPPEATLRLHFEFHADGTNRLYWWHEGENDLCERKGVWILADDTLHDRITWVNPRNAVGCARDPDMQVGRQTSSPISFDAEGNFQLHLMLGDDPLVYVWRKISDNGR